jgi:hypothetical protein
MGASRSLIGLVCVALAVGCAEANSPEIDSEDLNLEYEVANGPALPPVPAGATCLLIQRGTLGQVQDTDIGVGNGANWAMGNYPYTWTGPSPYDHWSAYQFDLGVVPPDANIVLGVFSNYSLWNNNSSQVRAHVINEGWDEATATWASFTQNGTINGWDPAVIGTLDPSGVGYHSLDITSTVKSWHSGATANHGLVLEENPVYSHTYTSSESSAVAERPSLYVCYSGGATPDPEPECAGAGDSCEDSSTCCEGSCVGGKCGLLPPPSGDPEEACSGDNAPCGAASPCCNPNAVCDGVCIPVEIVIIEEPPACFDIAVSCDDDGQCCSGQCQGGVCTDSEAACVQPDEADASGNPLVCSPNSPCCEGSSCILGLCFPDDTLWGGTCSVPGEACDPDGLGQWCCWNQACVEGVCK